MAQAEQQHGVVEAHIGNILQHYTPPIILTLNLYTNLYPSILYVITPEYTIQTLVTILTASYIYTLLWDPKTRYMTSMSDLTLFLTLAIFAVTSLLAIYCGLYARLAANRRRDPRPEDLHSSHAVAVHNTPFLRMMLHHIARFASPQQAARLHPGSTQASGPA